MEKFKVLFLTEARDFLLELDEKSRDKIIFNIDKSKVKNDNELFKKLKGEIWDRKAATKLISDIIQQNVLSNFCFLGQSR